MMQSVLTSDPKCEIGPVLAPAYAQATERKIKANYLNPIRKYEDVCPHTNYNCFEAAIDAYLSGDDEIRKDVSSYIRGYAEIVAPKPNKDAQNPFFGNNGYRAFEVLLGHLIVEKGPRATPNALFNLATDAEQARRVINMWAGVLRPGKRNGYCRSLRQKAKGIKAIIEETPKYWGDFLFYVSSNLEVFEDGGHLEHYGLDAVAKFADLRREPRVLVVMTPLEKLIDFAIYTALNNHAIFTAVKHDPKGTPIHMILDEFTVAKWPNFEKEMITMRGLGISAEMYVQDRGLLALTYGENEAKAIYNQSNCKQITAVDNEEEARNYSAMVGSTKERALSSSMKGHRFEDADYQFKDEEVPIKSPQALMAMPERRQIIKYRDMRPIEAILVPSWMIKGLRERLGKNPLEKHDPPDGPYVAEIDITKKGVKVISPKLPDDFSGFEEHKETGVPILQFSSFIWAYVWMAILFLPDLGLDISWPALRYQYEYRIVGTSEIMTRCDYIALDGEHFSIPGPECPAALLD